MWKGQHELAWSTVGFNVEAGDPLLSVAFTGRKRKREGLKLHPSNFYGIRKWPDCGTSEWIIHDSLS